ncbi:TlpA disulfide reductase family protein [uncultured Ferrimonas sp.]|uniref:TlpA family protein disulfide reductase n=1 Tax=uncultured Ferrimonas sp. TaxID=432640 RepID=UPI002601646E|nr:TlpA disulfide reductase family protein [uncultured Ferrimonas sp.]
MLKLIGHGRQLLAAASLLLCTQVQSVELGELAPDFTLKSLSGSNLNLAEQRGDIMVINFWASWCGPCRKEMPILDEMQQKYQDLGVQIWGVNVEQDNQAGRQFLANLNTELRFPILFDANNDLSESYNVIAMPTTVIVDRDGKVRQVYHGYKDGYEKKYEKTIKKLIRE